MAINDNTPTEVVLVADKAGNALATVGTGKVLAVDGQIKAGPGVLNAVIVTFVGVTAGDTVELVNSLTSTGTSLLTIVASAAAETVIFTPSVGISFSTGIFYDVTLSGGTATITAVHS